MIAMRDHVRLHVAIYTPIGASEPLPIMLLRTPYGINGYAAEFGSYLKDSPPTSTSSCSRICVAGTSRKASS